MALHQFSRLTRASNALPSLLLPQRTSYQLLNRRFSTSPAQHKTAIVTGAGRGIGKSIAHRLAADGFDVCISDHPSALSAAETVAAEISQEHDRKAIAVGADVARRADVQSLVRTAVSELGPLDVMVANAGIVQVKRILDVTEEDLERIYSINVFGCFHCYREAAAQLIEQGGGGRIIGAASIAGFRPFDLLGHYSSTKWAVRGLTHAFAKELAEYKINVNAYAPGIVGTAMWDLIDEEMGKIRGVPRGETLRKTSESISLGRTSVPEDVSKVVSYLAGPDSEYVTGQTLVVDGGIVYN